MHRREINEHILAGKLFVVYEPLSKEIARYALGDWADELRNIYQSYRQLAHFMASGVEDDRRGEVIAYLKRRLLALSDSLYRYQQKESSDTQYYSTLRLTERDRASDAIFALDPPEGPQTLAPEERPTYDNMVAKLFERVWVSSSLSGDLLAKITSSSEYLRKVLASAMTLGLTSHWDSHKVHFFLTELAREEISVSYRIRLLFGATVAFTIYHDRLHLYQEEFELLLATANEVYPLAPLFEEMVTSYLLATDTARVTETIEQNLPDIIKAQQDSNRLSSILQGLDEDEPYTHDPELDALRDKMQQLSKLEEEGADTLFATFRNFKRLPFFLHLSAWFLPFDEKHSVAAESIAQSEMLQKILPFFKLRMCDSDLYSIVLSASMQYQPIRINDPNLLVALDQLKASFVETEEQQIATAARKYLQDIYRFIKLYPRKDEVYRLFDELHVANLGILAPYVSLDKVNRTTTLFLLSHDRLDEAELLLKRMVGKNPADVGSLLRLAQIYYKKGEYARAASLYEQADLVEDLSQESQIKLAHAYRRDGQNQKALAIYEKYRQNPSIMLAIVATHIATKQYQQAIELLHEYLYASNEPHRAYRPLAWCYFMTLQYDKSEEYYQKITKKTPSDYLHEVYLSLLRKDNKKAMPTAIELMRTAENPQAVFQLVASEHAYIEDKGLSPAEVFLVLDTALLLAKEGDSDQKGETL